MGIPDGSDGKSACNAETWFSLGEEWLPPSQVFCLENPLGTEKV